NYAAARRLLDGVIDMARRNHLNLLLGLALSARGSNLALTENYADHIATLTEGIDSLQKAGDARDTVRPLYYLAMVHLYAGDLEGSLHFANRVLTPTAPEDSLRRTEVFWFWGLLLSRLGFPAYASAFLTESLQQARLTGNSQAVMGALSY